MFFSPALFAFSSGDNINNYLSVILPTFLARAVGNPVSSAVAFRKTRAGNGRVATAHSCLGAVCPHSYNHREIIATFSPSAIRWSVFRRNSSDGEHIGRTFVSPLCGEEYHILYANRGHILDSEQPTFS